MNSFSRKAFEYKVGLEAGVVEPYEVIAWADQMLISCEYNDDLANVSLSKSKSPKEIIHYLGCLADPTFEWDALRWTLGRIYKVLRESPERARDIVKFLERICVSHEYDLPDDLYFIIGLDDEFDLAERKIYGTVEEAIENLLNKLQSFSDSE